MLTIGLKVSGLLVAQDVKATKDVNEFAGLSEAESKLNRAGTASVLVFGSAIPACKAAMMPRV